MCFPTSCLIYLITYCHCLITCCIFLSSALVEKIIVVSYKNKCSLPHLSIIQARSRNIINKRTQVKLEPCHQ